MKVKELLQDSVCSEIHGAQENGQEIGVISPLFGRQNFERSTNALMKTTVPSIFLSITTCKNTHGQVLQ